MFRLFLVHGFLGSGKTTLLSFMARRLLKEGVRVGLITNDQVPDLVDTRSLSQTGAAVAEVYGSCFCCNFQGFSSAITQLRAEINPEVILAEPVGSCADLAATIVRPLQKRFTKEIDVRPMSVVVDASRFERILQHAPDALRSGAAYIFTKQIEEADILIINKIDLVAPSFLDTLEQHIRELNPSASIYRINARTGEGVDAWWEGACADVPSGARHIDIDYDLYAEGEAELGWLNATLELTGYEADWNRVISDLLVHMRQEFQQHQATIGHVKLILETDGAALMANMTDLSHAPSVQGTTGNSPTVRLTFNARVGLEPSNLESMVRETLQVVLNKSNIVAKEKTWQCIRPGRPKPTYRLVD